MSTASARVQEPSMEDILASIRRIIADDQGGAKPAPADADAKAEPAAEKPVPAAAAAPASENIAAQAALAPEAGPERPPSAAEPPDAAAAVPDFADLDMPVPDIMFAEVTPEPGPARVPPAARSAPSTKPADPPPRPRTRDELISTEATASIGDAFDRLSHTILAANARTLEDLVREMLKPMLKVWLDDNLPPLVERLVRAEIERVARGR